MARLNIYLEAQGPLLLGEGMAVGNVKSSRSYVPGSTWRGALAGAVINAQRGRRSPTGAGPDDRPALSPAFEEVFLSQQPVRFGFLYPVRELYTGAIGAETFVLPLTARTCKQQGGFHEPDHGIFDGLRNQLRSEVSGTHRSLSRCPKCGGRLERQRGQVSRRNQAYKQQKLGTRSFVRVGLNRYTETAQDQILYVMDAVVPGPGGERFDDPLTFAGSCVGTAAQLDTVRALVEEHLLPTDDGGYELRVGSARARGMGRVHLYIEDATTAEPDTEAATGQSTETAPMNDLAQRLDRFQMHDGRRLAETTLYASLTLRSPLQLLNDSGLYANRIDRGTLEAYVSHVPQSLQVLHGASTVEKELWNGWSSAWKLSKPSTPALAAGSTILVGAAENERAALLDFLLEIEQNGLGERLAEGWGDILVCDPFHLEYDEDRHSKKQIN